jgi:predicted transcriptional regulator
MKSLKNLKKKWYKKLKDAGFVDIEDADGNLRSSASRFSYLYSPAEFREIEMYYQVAQALLHTEYLPVGRDREIWRLHADGLTVREIARLMSVDKDTVNRVINDIKRRYIEPQG